ncbi:PAS domain S-box protein [Candidatus Neomarinimicrobiota bacterium]
MNTEDFAKFSKESAQGYQDILEGIEEGYFEVDLAGNLTFFNDSMCRIADLPREKLMGMNNRDYTTPATSQKMYQAFNEVYRTGRSTKIMDYEIIRTDGTIRNLELSASLIRNHDGEPIGYRGIVRDTTERVQSMKALQESEEKFRTLSEQSPNMIFINKGGRIIYANSKCEEIMGYTKEEFYAPDFDFLSLIAPESIPTVKQNYVKHERGEEVAPYEYALVAKDGRRIYGLHTTTLINLDGESAILGIIADLSERKQAEEELLRFKLGIEKSGEAVFLTDPDGTIRYVNPAFESIYGFAGEEAIGETPRILKSGEHSPETYKQFWETILAKEVASGELINKAKNGSIIHIEGSANPILDKHNEIIGFLAIQRDITERKRRANEIQRRTEDVSLINDVNSALNSGKLLGEVIELFSDRVKEMYSSLSVTGAGVYLFDDAREHLVMQNLPLSKKVIRQIEKLINRPLPQFRISNIAGSLHDEVMALGKTTMLDTPKTINQWMREFVTEAWISNSTLRGQVKKIAPQVRKLLGIKATLVIPLQIENETIGLMEISSAPQFDASDIQRLELISNQLTVAIRRKQTEDALRKSEERYRSIVHSSPMGIHLYRLEKENQLIFERANPVADQILGVNHHQFIGKTVEETFPGLVGTEIPDTYKRIAREGGHWDRENIVYQDDQISGAFEVHAFQVGPNKIATLFTDVTERKQKEEALRLTQFSVDHSSDAAFWMGQDAQFVYVNEIACRSLGYSRDELLAMTVHDVDPNFPTEVWPGHWEDLRREGSLSMISQHRKKNGQLIPVEIIANFVEYGGKEYNCAFVRDITERLEAEEALRESERMLREFHENAIEGIFRTTTDGRVLYANEAMARIFGYDGVEEFKQINTFELYQDKQARDRILKDLESLDYLQNLQLHLRRKDGADVWVQENATAVRDEQGNIRWIEGFLSDITSRREAEESLRDREEELRQSQKMEAVGHLAGGIAHDFNNVLTQISAATELLEANAEQTSGERYRNIILGAVERGKSVTDRILKFSRRSKPQYESFSIALLLNDIVHVLRHTLPKSIRINLETNNHDFSVWGDKGQLHQVFMNLCLNAADAMPKDGDLTLSIRQVDEDEARQHDAHPEQKFAAVGVSDTGVGMDNETIEKMFNPFFTTKKAGKGTGLGLPIVYSIINDHNGWVDVASQIEKGTTFTVGLPLSKERADQLTSDFERKDLVGNGEHILVVDDEPMLPMLLREILESANYVVSIAESGETALKRIRESSEPIDLIITDLDMRNMGGRELVESIRGDSLKTPVIVTSGYFDPDEVKELKNLDVERFMNKPFKVEEVIKLVYESLSA